MKLLLSNLLRYWNVSLTLVLNYFSRLRSAVKIPKRSKILVAFENKEAAYGTGVFTSENISKGDRVWRFDENDCIRWAGRDVTMGKLLSCTRLTESSIKLLGDEKLASVLYKGFLNPPMDKVNLDNYWHSVLASAVENSQQPNELQGGTKMS